MTAAVPRLMWAVHALGEKEEQPQMFFANEQWARDAVASLAEDDPGISDRVSIYQVRVTYEVEP